MNTQSATESPRLLRIPEVSQRTGLGQSTIYAKMAASEFPRSIKLTAHSSAWLESDVNAWIAERVAASRDVA